MLLDITCQTTPLWRHKSPEGRNKCRNEYMYVKAEGTNKPW